MPEITLCAAVSSIQCAMQFLREQLGERHSDFGAHVELAAEELLVNVASYAYADDASKESGKIVFGCRWVNMDGCDQFCLWVRDWGHSFDPFRGVETPDISLPVEERDVGGLGVHLIKHISSHYIYSGSDGSNTVELYFKPVAAR